MKKEFLKLSIPNILTNLTVPLVSLVDVALMGRMPSSYYIIAIGFGTLIFNFLYWAFGFLRMGTTGMVSQAFGANDEKKSKAILFKGVIVALSISFLILLFQNQILSLSLNIIKPDKEVLSLLSQYFKVRVYAAPATILLYVIVGWLLGMQDAKRSLVLALVLHLSNALLSYIFVWELNESIKGVALGTVCAQYIGLIAGLFILGSKYKLKLSHFKLIKDEKFEEWKRFLLINKDIFIRTLCLIFTLSFFKAKAGNIDPILGAANILLLEFVTISAYGIDGLAFAAESIAGKYFGKRSKIELTQSIRIAFKYGIGFGVIIALLFYIFGTNILTILTDKENVIDMAILYLPWLVLAPIVNSFAFIWDGIYIGCTAAKEMMYTLLISTFLVFLPAFYFFSYWLGNHGIWLALTLFMLSRGIIQTVLAPKAIYRNL